MQSFLPPTAGLAFRTIAIAALIGSLGSGAAFGQTSEGSASGARDDAAGVRWRAFLGGAAVGFAGHEAAHLLLNLVFDADPAFRRVSFGGIPFFAITPQQPLTPRRQFAVSSAGFWAQHGLNEWLLRRALRDERAPFSKGVLAFNLGTSAGYSVAALARAGPAERDTRGMARSARISERWIGVLVLAPAALDAYRYARPGARWASWTARASKVGMVMLVLR